MASRLSEGIKTRVGVVKGLSRQLERSERVKNVLVRQGAGRSDYKVTPGLYALGQPTEESDVLVSANYKLTLDILRTSVKTDVWVLILDTHGINVWCAAGKGTFSTAELIRMIGKCRLNRIVKHKRLILPQLGAPGVRAVSVTEKTGFQVLFGPVDAKDIDEYINSGYQATESMRTVGFGLKERLILTPLEFMQSLRLAAVLWVIFMLIMALTGGGKAAMAVAVVAAGGAVGAVFMGSVVFPGAFPFLKGRYFTVRALPISVLWTLCAFALSAAWPGNLERMGFALACGALVELCALNFTGATPITSYSETKAETLGSIPYFAGTAVLSLGLYLWGILGVSS